MIVVKPGEGLEEGHGKLVQAFETNERDKEVRIKLF